MPVKKKKERVGRELERAMFQQGVDKVEDLKWVIFTKTMTREELVKIYPKIYEENK